METPVQVEEYLRSFKELPLEDSMAILQAMPPEHIEMVLHAMDSEDSASYRALLESTAETENNANVIESTTTTTTTFTTDTFYEDDKEKTTPQSDRKPEEPTETEAENECAICLEILDRDVVVTSCYHKFHKHCIEPWLQNKREEGCPICRTQDPQLYEWKTSSNEAPETTTTTTTAQQDEQYPVDISDIRQEGASLLVAIETHREMRGGSAFKTLYEVALMITSLPADLKDFEETNFRGKLLDVLDALARNSETSAQSKVETFIGRLSDTQAENFSQEIRSLGEELIKIVKHALAKLGASS